MMKGQLFLWRGLPTVSSVMRGCAPFNLIRGALAHAIQRTLNCIGRFLEDLAKGELALSLCPSINSFYNLSDNLYWLTTDTQLFFKAANFKPWECSAQLRDKAVACSTIERLVYHNRVNRNLRQSDHRLGKWGEIGKGSTCAQNMNIKLFIYS